MNNNQPNTQKLGSLLQGMSGSQQPYVAALLQNQINHIVSGTMSSGSFATMSLPIVRRQQNILAKNIVSIQPMHMPTSMTFYEFSYIEDERPLVKKWLSRVYHCMNGAKLAQQIRKKLNSIKQNTPKKILNRWAARKMAKAVLLSGVLPKRLMGKPINSKEILVQISNIDFAYAILSNVGYLVTPTSVKKWLEDGMPRKSKHLPITCVDMNAFLNQDYSVKFR